MISGYNSHHIIAKQGRDNQKNLSKELLTKKQNIKNGVITIDGQGYRSTLYKKYPLTTDLTSNGWFFGADLHSNILGMTNKRHNFGLNQRYDGNMLPHHMLLAELLYAPVLWSSDTILKKIKEEIISLFANQTVEKIYRPECFVVITDDGEISNRHILQS